MSNISLSTIKPVSMNAEVIGRTPIKTNTELAKIKATLNPIDPKLAELLLGVPKITPPLPPDPPPAFSPANLSLQMASQKPVSILA
jgi:hypothetical protein